VYLQKYRPKCWQKYRQSIVKYIDQVLAFGSNWLSIGPSPLTMVLAKYAHRPLADWQSIRIGRWLVLKGSAGIGIEVKHVNLCEIH